MPALNSAMNAVANSNMGTTPTPRAGTLSNSVNAQRFRMVSSALENGFVAAVLRRCRLLRPLIVTKWWQHCRLDLSATRKPAWPTDYPKAASKPGRDGRFLSHDACGRKLSPCPANSAPVHCVFFEPAHNRRMSSASRVMSHGFSHLLTCRKRLGICSAP